MSRIKYVCIDDDSDNNLEPLTSGLEEVAPNLKIERVNLAQFEDITDNIKRLNPDGIILDLRLDQNVQNGFKAKYHGTSLAQELRTKMTEGSFPSCPIVLWSINTKLAKSFQPDDTGHDLFDGVYQKDNEVIHVPRLVSAELIALSKAYEKIKTLHAKPGHAAGGASIFALLGAPKVEQDSLDPRIADPFSLSKRRPAHDYARYVLQNVVKPAGVLIDEKVLAARLGVDLKKSADWNQLLKALPKPTKYSGVFAEGWPRWWAASVNSWWDKLKKSTPLKSTSASDRVLLLKRELGLKKLIAASPIEAGYGTRFWMICEAYGVPLDPINAVRVAAPDLKPFQDAPMISIKAALERVGFDRGLRPHPLEQQRLAQIKNEAKKAKAN